MSTISHKFTSHARSLYLYLSVSTSKIPCVVSQSARKSEFFRAFAIVVFVTCLREFCICAQIVLMLKSLGCLRWPHVKWREDKMPQEIDIFVQCCSQNSWMMQIQSRRCTYLHFCSMLLRNGQMIKTKIYSCAELLAVLIKILMKIVVQCCWQNGQMMQIGRGQIKST